MLKDLKYTTWSSIFIAYINLTRRGLPLQRISQVDTSEFFLATESLSQPVTVVPFGNAPTRVSPALILSPKKNSLADTLYKRQLKYYRQFG
jgi:hypothetical protein